MHELALVRSVYNVIEDKIQEYDVHKVVRVSLVIGELTGVEDAAMKGCFEVCVQSTPAEGAQLDIKRVPARLKCRACGREYVTGLPFADCPDCSGKSWIIVGGREFYIDSLEVE